MKILRQLLLVLAILVVSVRPSIAQSQPPTFTITASAGANGSISPSGAVTVTQGADQTFSITPNSGYYVSDVTVDGSSVGAVTSYTFPNVQTDHTISADFAPPNANPATFTVAESTKKTPSTLTDTLTGIPNDGSLTFRASTSTLPSHGTVKVDSGGSFTYTPDTEYVGTDSFGFIASNGSVDSPEATVTVSVTYVEEPPTANPVAASIPPNQTLYGQLLGFNEADNALTYSAVTQPSNGTVAVDSQGGHFTYVPNNNFTGVDSFTYKVNDGTLDSDPGTVSIAVGADSVGFIADTVIANVTGADLVNAPVYSPASVSGPAVDEAVDRANQRLYVLTANALNIYDITAPTTGQITGAITPGKIPSVTLSSAGERLALSLDGRTAYIGSKGQVTAINLYPEYVASKGILPAYTYLRNYSFGMDRDVAAMGVHPAGDRLYVVIDMDPNSKSLNIANALVLSDAGQGTTAAQALTTANLADYGFLTYLDISADLALSQANQTPAKFVTPINLKDTSVGVAVLDIRRMAFSPDGNYALICGVGAQSPRITPFGVAPTSDAGTGGTLVVDVRRYTDPKSSTPPTQLSQIYLGYIPDSENGVNTAKMIQQVQQKGATIIHPDVLAAGLLASVAQGATDVSSSAGASGIGLLPDSLIALDATSAAYDLLWQSYEDYGNMQAYFDLYPRDMVGASGVAISHAGDFGVVTMQDTNNLGLLNLSLSKDNASGYSSANMPANFYITRGTGKTINGFDAALNGDEAPTKTFSEWAFPQMVAFTSDDSRIFIGMANGGPTSNKTNQAGTANAVVLKTARDDPNSVFLSNSPPPGYVLAGNGGFESPRLATTLQSFDSSYDSLSDQVKAYNRWNSLRPLSQIDPQNLTKKPTTDPDYLTVAQCLAKIVSTDVNHLTIPGTVYKSDPNIPDSLNVGFFLPLSGIGYRVNTFGMPADTTNYATRGVVTALEQIGLFWNQLYHNPGYQPPTGAQALPGNLPTITRPYYVIGLMSQPGGGAIQNQAGEALQSMPANASEVDFPYFRISSDASFDFVLSNGPGDPTNNTVETKDGFDEPNTEALIRLLLAQSQVTKIELDPYLLEIIKAAASDIGSDPRFVPHGLHFDDPTKENTSRRDMDDHMHVTFSYSQVDLFIDPDIFKTQQSGVTSGTAFDSTIPEFLVNPQPGYFDPISLYDSGDMDGDGVPDYASGFDFFPNEYKAGAAPIFTPMMIRFPDGVNPATTQFTLTYPESDPTQVQQVNNPAYDPNNPSAAPQHLYVLPATGLYRIWTKDGPQARHVAEINAQPAGDFIASEDTPTSGKVYKISDLLASATSNREPGSNKLTVTVYIESVNPGIVPNTNDVSINIMLNPQTQTPATPNPNIIMTRFSVNSPTPNVAPPTPNAAPTTPNVPPSTPNSSNVTSSAGQSGTFSNTQHIGPAIEIVSYQNLTTYTVDQSNPVLNYVRFGLWDNAFPGSLLFSYKDSNDEAGNFVGSDSRRFYIKVTVNDQSTIGDGTKIQKVTVDWYTQKPGPNNQGKWLDDDHPGADKDHPGVDTITLTQIAPSSPVFASKALMLVSDDVDNEQGTATGDTGALSSGAGVGEADHRLRRAAIGDQMCVGYTPKGATTSTLTLPIFNTSPNNTQDDVVRTLNIQLVNTKGGTGGLRDPVATGDLTTGDIAFIAQVIQQRYAVAGIKVNIIYNSDPTNGDILNVATNGDILNLKQSPKGPDLDDFIEDSIGVLPAPTPPQGQPPPASPPPATGTRKGYDEEIVAAQLRQKYSNGKVDPNDNRIYVILIGQFDSNSPLGSSLTDATIESFTGRMTPAGLNATHCCFVSMSSLHPTSTTEYDFVASHEIGHQLSNRSAKNDDLANGGHYEGPNGLKYNLMTGGLDEGGASNGVTGHGEVTDAKRLWNDPAHPVNGTDPKQIDYIRSSPLLQPSSP